MRRLPGSRPSPLRPGTIAAGPSVSSLPAIVAAALLAATLLYRDPAAAQDGPLLEEIVPPPELGRGSRPIDIGRMTWRVSASDSAAMARREYDDSSWVARAGVSQEILRNSTAWYRFTFVLAEGSRGLGSKLELGGVEGNVAVYLNGTLLGEMRGETVPPFARTETFVLPASLLDPERNVLAIRLTGHAGRAKVGIPQGPIRLYPLSTTYEAEERATRALQDADRAAALLGGLTSRLEDFGLQARRAKVLLASGGAQSGVDAALAALDSARKAALPLAPGPASSMTAPSMTSTASASSTVSTVSAGRPAAGFTIASTGDPTAATPPAFGRFGRSHSEGLLTATLWPGGFQSATTSFDPAPVAGEFGSGSASDHAALEYISPESKTVRVVQALGSRYRLHYPLMYPGFAVEPLDATLSVRFNRQMDALWVDRWGVATASADVRATVGWTEPWLLLYDRAGSRPPILIALSSLRSELRLGPAPGGFEIVLPARTIARFCWPMGLTPWSPGRSGASAGRAGRGEMVAPREQGTPRGRGVPRGLEPDRQAAPGIWASDMARFRMWADAMVPFTRSAIERPRGGRLFVRETFGYLPAGAVPYAPLPPAYGLLLAAASDSGKGIAARPEGETAAGPGAGDAGRPAAGPVGVTVSAQDIRIASEVRAPQAVDLGVPTLAGPLWAVRRSHTLDFSLPLPAIESLAIPRIEGAPQSGAGDLPDPLAGNAMDLAFTRRVAAVLRSPGMSKQARGLLDTNGQVQLARAWGPLAWADATEPLTGRAYRWTLGKLGPGGRIDAVARPNALAIYGTSVATLFSGDWAFPAAQWNRIARAFDWLQAGFDWAWQAPVDTDAGIRTGDRETLIAAYLGALGMARMAPHALPGGSSEAAAPYLAYAARLRPLFSNLGALDDYGRANGLLGPTEWAIARHEQGLEPATGSIPVSFLLALPELSQATASSPVLVDWAPARLEDLVWKPGTSTLEARLALKQATDRFAVRVRGPEPREARLNGQEIATTYDRERGITSIEPGQAAGMQTLVLKF